jgi:hypothetical protein
LAAGGILIGGLVVWMAWQRFAVGGNSGDTSSVDDGAEYYRQKSEIYLAPITIADREVSIGAPSPLTTDGRAAFAPSFTVDGKSVLFSSTRDDVDRSEIYRYDIERRQIARLTDTREIEFTPAPLSDGAHFAAGRMRAEFLRVEGGGGRRIGMISDQELWTFALDGSGARRVLLKVGSVAAQQWLDFSTVAMIVRGKQNVLVVVNVGNGKVDTVLRDVASGTPGFGTPTLARNRARNALVIARGDDTSAVLTEVNWQSHATRDLMKLPAELTSFALIADDLIIASTKSRLMCWQSSRASWIEVANLADIGVGPIMQLAASPDGKWLALSAAGMSPDGTRETFDAFVRSAAAKDGAPVYRLPSACVMREARQ